MAGKTPRIIIAEALEDLIPENLDKFRVRLRERKSDGPRLRRARVDGKNPLQLADLLVETFTAGKAVAVTLELLRAVGCNAVADDLEEDAKDLPRPAPQGPDSNSSPPAGACAAPAEQEHFVDRHRIQLTERVSNINPILDWLREKKVLQPEQYDEVQVIRPKQEQMRFLYHGPLKSGGKHSKDVLMSALEEQEPYLMQDLREQDG